MAECYIKNLSDGCDWKFPDKIPGLGDKYRYMNKNATYDSSTKNLEVHSAALPADNFFYRLVTKFGNTDAGRKNAAMIWFEALADMSSGTQYPGARKYTVGAARALAAAGEVPGNAETYVKDAWNAVGVPQQPGE
jgi:Zn-dependent metalloprotease